METQTLFQKAITFSALKHLEKQQTIPGTDLPYVVHLSNVAMEVIIAYYISTTFDLALAVQMALLHDTLEDTAATFEEIAEEFGPEIAQGVSALTKNEQLPKSERMADSLNRIKALSKEVWVVKLADRITNLQEPPKHWSASKKQDYHQEALQILQHLKGANPYLEQRLKRKIAEYEKYI